MTGLVCSACMLSDAHADIDAQRVTKALRRAAPTKVLSHPLSRGDGRIPLLVRLPAGVTAADRALMEVAPGFGAIHLTPGELEAYSATYPDVRPVAAPPRKPMLDASNRWHGAATFRDETGLDGEGVVIGIIDTGIDASHPDFLDADGFTRIAWLMHRQDPTGEHPELEAAYGCNDPAQSPCAFFSSQDIQALLLLQPEGAPRDFDGHGTHVSSLAAGNGGISIDDDPRFVGIAPKATLIIASPSSGGGFVDPDIINAARFIFEQAEAMGMPAVVNISLGSDFGPHDGTSALEQGLAALVGDGQPGRVMVIAAGNGGAVYPIQGQGRFGVHTEGHASPNAVMRVPIQQPGASGTVTGSGFVWVNFRPGDEVSVGLEGPGGTEWISPVASGDDEGYDDDEIIAGVINNVIDDRSQLTSETNGAVVFWEGSWDGGNGHFAVLLQGRGDAQLWVTGVGGAAAGGTTLGLMFDRAHKAGTISVPASHPELIAVGCTLNRTGWRPSGSLSVLQLQSFGDMSPPVADSVCYFSGAGPTPQGGMKPDILAPGGFVAGAMSRDADPRINSESIFLGADCPDDAVDCYLVDNSHALTTGTSMSAPMVSGAAALLLQRDPNLTQRDVLEIIQAGAARPSGLVPYEYQQGPGELHLPGMLQAYEDISGGGGKADVASSWYALSSPYLRPNPDWPVHGTIELRHGDGDVATGISAGRLTVRVTGGIVIDAPTKVRAGLFRFAVAAPRGSGGSEATVEVLYEGQSLGVRTLPIGVDVWAASGGVKAVGACAIQPPSKDARPSALWLLLGLMLLARRQNAGKGSGQHDGVEPMQIAPPWSTTQLQRALPLK